MEAIFISVINMSIAASWVIAAVLAARLLLQRAPKKYAYWLWAAVGFRLVIPKSLTLPISLFGLLGRRSDPMTFVPADIGMMADPAIDTAIPPLDAAVNAILPPASPITSANPLQIWLAVGTLLWLAGVIVMLLWAILSSVRIGWRMQKATKLDEGVYQSENVRSPFVFGLIRPRIYIPYSLEGEALSCVLAHERYHIAHRDYLVKPFAWLLLSIHWFNPLCWLAFRMMGRDMEMRVDEAVLEGGCDRKIYSSTLLALAANRRILMPGLSGFGESSVSRRIGGILNWKKPGRAAGILSMMLVVLIAVSCASDPAAYKAATPFGKIWDIGDAVYTSAALKADSRAFRVMPFRILEDGTVRTPVSDGELPKLNETLLTAENFDSRIDTTQESTIRPEEMRKNNKQAWSTGADGLQLILLQKDGSLYAVYSFLNDPERIDAIYPLKPGCIVAAVSSGEMIRGRLDTRFDYDVFPTMDAAESDTILLDLDTGEDHLVISEDYYLAVNDDAVSIKKQTFTLERQADGYFHLEVSRRGTTKYKESANYFLAGEAGRFVFNLNFGGE